MQNVRFWRRILTKTLIHEHIRVKPSNMKLCEDMSSFSHVSLFRQTDGQRKRGMMKRTATFLQLFVGEALTRSLLQVSKYQLFPSKAQHIAVAVSSITDDYNRPTKAPRSSNSVTKHQKILFHTSQIKNM